MKKLFSIVICFVILHFSIVVNGEDRRSAVTINDTTKLNVQAEDEAIEEVLKSRTAPKAEKVQ